MRYQSYILTRVTLFSETELFKSKQCRRYIFWIIFDGARVCTHYPLDAPRICCMKALSYHLRYQNTQTAQVSRTQRGIWYDPLLGLIIESRVTPCPYCRMLFKTNVGAIVLTGSQGAQSAKSYPAGEPEYAPHPHSIQSTSIVAHHIHSLSHCLKRT